MKKWGLLPLILIVSTALCGCQHETSDASVPSPVREATTNEVHIVDLQDSYAKVLEHATADYIGHHPIDEGFMTWYTNTYGQEALESLIAAANYSDPEEWYKACGNSIHVLWYQYCKATGLQFYEFGNIYEPATASDDAITFTFTGDVNLADGVATRNFMDRQKNGLVDCFSPDLLELMQQSDVFVVNNEFAFTNRGTALSGKAFTFRADPKLVTQISAIGTDVVTLGNNHVWDYGEIGMKDTLSTFRDIELPYIGAGENLDEAEKIIYYVAGGRKIALVDATQIERTYDYTKEATDERAGVLKCLHPEKYCSVISRAKKNADIVIAVVHWGTEGNAMYGQDQINLANAFIHSGADVIIGGHPHCLQGIEFVGDVPIYYSLGNYWFSSTSNMPTAYDTGLAEVTIHSDGKTDLRFIPCHFEFGVTSLVTDTNDSRALYDYVESISNTIRISDDGAVTHK
ncbi:MAG: CapA family protein [Lachnospiraceae bacterium]|nr:CapA family protein [Lachnospiraceae bacterium]